jgi:hypothetical protein
MVPTRGLVNRSSAAVAQVEIGQNPLGRVSAIQILGLNLRSGVVRSVDIVSAPQQRGGMAPATCGRLSAIFAAGR